MTMQHHYDLADLTETQLLATQVAGKLHAGDVIILTGDLGAGKTTSPRR